MLSKEMIKFIVLPRTSDGNGEFKFFHREEQQETNLEKSIFLSVDERDELIMLCGVQVDWYRPHMSVDRERISVGVDGAVSRLRVVSYWSHNFWINTQSCSNCCSSEGGLLPVVTGTLVVVHKDGVGRRWDLEEEAGTFSSKFPVTKMVIV